MKSLDFKKNGISTLLIPFFACLTLGLAPHTPEPHLVEKFRWIFGGEKVLAPIDWFDVLLHGAPWVWFFVVLIKLIKANMKNLRHDKNQNLL